MKRATFLAVVLVAALLAGCTSFVSSFLQGGTVKPHDYTPVETLVSYRAEGPAPEGVTFHLVRTEKGLAILEKSATDMHALIETHWRSERGDHFASWVNGSTAFVYVVPDDRSREAGRYAYPSGAYRIRTVDGVTRPVPAQEKAKPDTLLIPRG